MADLSATRLRGATHVHTVIFLHDRDSCGLEIAAELFMSQASDGRKLPKLYPGLKWEFPTAGVMISDRPLEREEEQELFASVARIQGIVTEEAAIVGPENVILGGMGQGCAVAIHALLKGGSRLGRFIGLMSWARRKGVLYHCKNNTAIQTPASLSHAQNDYVVAISFGEGLRDTLSNAGMEVCWTSYVDAGHWMNEPQVDDIVAFLRRIGIGSA